MAIAATYVSATSFTVKLDRTDEFPKGARVQANCGSTDGKRVVSVESSSYAANVTTVTVDLAILTSNLQSVLYGNNSTDSFPLDNYHLKKTGRVYYVATGGDDTDSGYELHPFAGIGAALSVMVPGDWCVVGPGTYTKTGLDIGTGGTVHGLNFYFEAGVVIDPASGTALTVSSNYATLDSGSALFVTPAAGETGVVISGNRVYPHNIRVDCGSVANIGYDITGNGIDGSNLRCANPLVAAFKIQGDKVKIDDCCTGGEVANTSIGVWLTNSCDKFRAKNTGTQGHSTAGWQVDAGCTNAGIKDCYSGGGDGTKIDNGTFTTWPGFNFDDKVLTTTTFAGVPTEYNIYKLTGGVRMINYYSHVTTVIPNTACDVYLQLYSTNGTVSLTDAPGVDIDSAVVGATLIRNGPVNEELELANPDSTPAVIENSNFRRPSTEIDVFADDSATTYVRLVLSAALASGAIHHHVEYEPLTDDGFLEPA